MAEREIPCKSCEFPSRGRERELVEEEECMDEEEVDDSNDSDESDGAIIYDSDDSDFDIVDGPNADRKVWNQYYREWNESEVGTYAIIVCFVCYYRRLLLVVDVTS